MRKLAPLFFIFIINNALSQQTVGVFFNEPESFNGYTMIAASGSDTVYLIDNCGYQVHKWATGGDPGQVTYLLENGEILRTGRVPSSIYSGGGSGGLVKKYSWEGELIWSYQVSDSTIHQHHDVEYLPNGNVLVLCWGYVPNDVAILNGRDPDNLNNEIWPTVIQEIEPVYPDGGNIVWQWNVWDHLVQDFDPTKSNFGVIADHPELLDINFSSNGNPDFLHCNAVNYNAMHDLIMLCSRYSGEIYVIDHSTSTEEAASHAGGVRGRGGDFLYRWGNPQIYNRGNLEDQVFYGPHDAHWIPDSLIDGGKIMVFNNLGGSNGSALNIFNPPMDSNGDFPDPGNSAFGPLAVDWHYEEPGFSSSTISGVQRLPNGNTLVCEGAGGHLFELTQSEMKVWDYVNPSSVSGNYAQGINPVQNSMFRAYRYPVDYPAFADKDLTPSGLIELDPDPDPCDIVPEPLGIAVLTKFEELKVVMSNDVLRIKGSVDMPSGYAAIYDINGRARCTFEVRNEEHHVDLSGWPKGVYVLTFTSAKYHRTLKFIYR